MSKRAMGRIAVYSKDHKLLEQYLYYTGTGMSKKMDEFKKDYAGVKGIYISVTSYAEDDKIEVGPDNDFAVSETKARSLVRLENGQEVERPPAVYNNRPIYKYDE